MKRLGFRDIYHYLSNDLGTLGTAHTNLYYDSFEMFINIPFVKTIKHNFNLSLIYVFKGYGPNGFIGKLQCPLQRTFSYDNDDKKLIITNFDGIVYTFKLASDLSYTDIIERMKYYLNANYDDSLIENKANFYEVYDYANGIHYLYQKSQSVSTFFNFPKYIFLNDGSKIEFSMNNGVVTIDFGYDEKVEMQYDSSFLINEIKYKINDFVYQRTTFTVSSNNKLTIVDVMVYFTLGSALGGVGYGVSKGITSIFADKKIFGILGNLSDNAKVNKRLTKAGFGNLKIGKNGL